MDERKDPFSSIPNLISGGAFANAARLPKGCTPWLAGLLILMLLSPVLIRGGIVLLHLHAEKRVQAYVAELPSLPIESLYDNSIRIEKAVLAMGRIVATLSRNAEKPREYLILFGQRDPHRAIKDIENLMSCSAPLAAPVAGAALKEDK